VLNPGLWRPEPALEKNAADVTYFSCPAPRVMPVSLFHRACFLASPLMGVGVRSFGMN
jgi:hypothetical protein